MWLAVVEVTRRTSVVWKFQNGRDPGKLQERRLDRQDDP